MFYPFLQILFFHVELASQGAGLWGRYLICQILYYLIYEREVIFKLTSYIKPCNTDLNNVTMYSSTL